MHPVPVEIRHNLTHPLVRGEYITRAPFHDSCSIRETWRPSHLFPIRSSRPSFSLFSLSAVSSFAVPPSRNIVRSDYAIQCVAFNSTPRSVGSSRGCTVEKKTRRRGVTRDGLNGEERNRKGKRSIGTLSCVI